MRIGGDIYYSIEDLKERYVKSYAKKVHDASLLPAFTYCESLQEFKLILMTI